MRSIIVKETAQDVATELRNVVESCAREVLEKREQFFLGLSGGSLADILANELQKISTDWKKWKIFFCDERHVPLTDPDSTFRVYKEGLMTRVPISDDQIHKIKPLLTVEDAALEYTNQLREAFGECDWPVFDLLLLGMGPDGHTCSLFPDHALLQEDKLWIAPISDSPKPPPRRITMTFPVINKARNAAFAVCGQAKAGTVKMVLEGSVTNPLPAARVASENVKWILDKPAASELSLS